MTQAKSKEMSFGMLNFENKYLTAEKFGNQINVSGNALRLKQTWCFEKPGELSSQGYLKSSQNRYLETNKNGNVSCINTDPSEDCLFTVEVADDGRLAFKDCYGKYLAGNSERLYTSFKMTIESVWAIHFTLHPQCNLKSMTRKRYVDVEDGGFHAKIDIPWGINSIVTLKFVEGKYTIQDSNGRYLNGDTGELIAKIDRKNCRFNMSLHDNSFAFYCGNGKYLTIHGTSGKLIASKDSIGKDELFNVEESKAQVTLTACNGRLASVKQGVDVTANQVSPAESTEIFQLGYHMGRRDKVTFLTQNNKYWCADEKSITATNEKLSPDCVFQLQYYGNKIALKASNNKWITSSTGGSLCPSSEIADSNALFTLALVNKSRIILRGKYGYMGITNSKKVQCNLGIPETLKLIESNGKYLIKTSGELFLKVDSNLSLITTAADGGYFTIELYSMTKLQIKADNGQYLFGNQNGCIIAGSDEANENTLWEY